MRNIKKRKQTTTRFQMLVASSVILLVLVFTLNHVLTDRSRVVCNGNEDLTTIATEASETTETLPSTTEAVVKFKDYLSEGNPLELPINGATGYASIPLDLKDENAVEANVIQILEAGKGFTIIDEVGEWWLVDVDGITGWVLHKFCLVNLPDVIPSIVYDNINSYASKMRSSGVEIPNITEKKLYDAKFFNPRFNKDEFAMPVLYAMARKISTAQQAALKDGNTLILYEAFRPYETQKAIFYNLSELIRTNLDVEKGVTTEPWTIGWFIATGTSNHQKGYAIDIGLGKVTHLEVLTTGLYQFNEVIDYLVYEMPTQIHELSEASVVYTQPVTSFSETDWKVAILSDTMNENAILLQKYCTDAGLTPLASEWWHFNDITSLNSVKGFESNGQFMIQNVYSKMPNP